MAEWSSERRQSISQGLKAQAWSRPARGRPFGVRANARLGPIGPPIPAPLRGFFRGVPATVNLGSRG
ncbi:MAG: hypothetical protein RL077_2855 [Verrucomicrobiota bacterium]|jgi:hypothetical protein